MNTRRMDDRMIAAERFPGQPVPEGGLRRVLYFFSNLDTKNSLKPVPKFSYSKNNAYLYALEKTNHTNDMEKESENIKKEIIAAIKKAKKHKQQALARTAREWKREGIKGKVVPV